uniref:Putative secreted protein n=1 Tax=Amblyomma triste TaxID=251400 RepID=A0A023G3J7_AMBTT
MPEPIFLWTLTIVFSLHHVQGAQDSSFSVAYSCSRKIARVNKNFNVTGACVEFCSDGNTSEINDESVCEYEATYPGRLSDEWVLRTGHCVNGTCLEPGEESRQSAVNISCLPPPRETFEGELLFPECTYSCLYEGTENVPDGSPCVLKRRHNEDFLTGYKPPTEAGVCKNGSCVHDQSKKCRPELIDATREVKVVKNCSIKCPNGTLGHVPDGRQCALRTSRRWSYFFKKYASATGICQNGICVPYPNKTEQEDPQCRGQEVSVNKEVTIAVGCQVRCKNGTIVNRPDGTVCLFEYRLLHHGWFSSLESYGLGHCGTGVCVSGEHPYVITVEETPKYKHK